MATLRRTTVNGKSLTTGQTYRPGEQWARRLLANEPAVKKVSVFSASMKVIVRRDGDLRLSPPDGWAIAYVNQLADITAVQLEPEAER